jgi:hypothetical protein
VGIAEIGKAGCGQSFEFTTIKTEGQSPWEVVGKMLGNCFFNVIIA